MFIIVSKKMYSADFYYYVIEDTCTIHYITWYDYVFQIILIMTEYSFLMNKRVKYSQNIHFYS